MNYENEVWKDIPGYEGLYQVSSIGRVKALPRKRVNWTGGEWIQPERILAQTKNEDGYACVGLSLDGKRMSYRVHQLVARAFIPNPNQLPEINHVNCIRDDNRVENLEWVSHQENCAYTAACGHKSTKRVKCLETNEIFNTSTEAAKKNGGDPGNIRTACRKGRSVYGFHYTYIE